MLYFLIIKSIKIAWIALKFLMHQRLMTSSELINSIYDIHLSSALETESLYESLCLRDSTVSGFIAFGGKRSQLETKVGIELSSSIKTTVD